jgi:hypothetical protein
VVVALSVISFLAVQRSITRPSPADYKTSLFTGSRSPWFGKH